MRYHFTISVTLYMHYVLTHVWLYATPWTIPPPGSSVHGILQARILEWAAMPCSRLSSQPRDWTCTSYVSYIGRLVLYHQHHLELGWFQLKRLTTPSASEDVEQSELSYSAHGNVKWHGHLEKQIIVVQKVKNTSSFPLWIPSISFSSLIALAVCMLVALCIWHFTTTWTVAHQAPMSLEFSRQEYWSVLPFPSPSDLLDPEIEPESPAGGCFTIWATSEDWLLWLGLPKLCCIKALRVHILVVFLIIEKMLSAFHHWLWC